MKDEEILGYFNQQLNNEDMTVALASVLCLTEVLRRSDAQTVMEIGVEIKQASKLLKKHMQGRIQVQSGCQIFKRYMNDSFKATDFHSSKRHLIERGDDLIALAKDSRKRISQNGERFITGGSVVLVHGYSRAVVSLLLEAASSSREQEKQFSVFVTESRFSGGSKRILEELGDVIPCSLILDSAAAHVMPKVDMVLMGALGVVESGGIVNEIGSYQVAVIARALNKPVYIATESVKFVRKFPLSQEDVAKYAEKTCAVSEEIDKAIEGCPTARFEAYASDYTPPEYITLLFTDIGVMTPSAVSDELIKLYEHDYASDEDY
eukprot:Rmarinus@m.27815